MVLETERGVHWDAWWGRGLWNSDGGPEEPRLPSLSAIHVFSPVLASLCV